MQKGTKAELQMLREMAWAFLSQIKCCFCSLPLVQREPGMTFGHRRHPSVKVKLTVHHRDRNRENNKPDNLGACHQACHIAHHAKERRKHEPIIGGGIISCP